MKELIVRLEGQDVNIVNHGLSDVEILGISDVLNVQMKKKVIEQQQAAVLRERIKVVKGKAKNVKPKKAKKK